MRTDVVASHLPDLHHFQRRVKAESGATRVHECMQTDLQTPPSGSNTKVNC
jgi:hypothetical protein